MLLEDSNMRLIRTAWLVLCLVGVLAPAFPAICQEKKDKAPDTSPPAAQPEADPNRRRPEARSERPNALLGAALKPMRRFAGAVSARVQAIAQP